MIELKDVTKSYGSVDAVRDVSFTVNEGEILGFLGPNGAGKTTTMKMITCYMPPTSGAIFVDGMNVVEESMEVRRKIGYLPEQTPLYEDMGVREYLKFVADVRQLEKTRVRAAMERVVSECGLESVIHKDINELSKGFRQRVGLAQAILHDPEMLILDEPTTGLDPNQIMEIRNLIRKLGEEKTVIFSTHIMQEVQATSDRVLIINNGTIAAQGTPEELQASVEGQQNIVLVVKNCSKEELESALRAYEGVVLHSLHATRNGNVEAEFSVGSSQDLREELFDLTVRNQWKLLQLTPNRMNLEDVFRELTH